MSKRRFGRGSMRRVTVTGQTAWEIDYRDASGKRCRYVAAATKPEAQAILAKKIRDRNLELNGMGAERGASMQLRDLGAQYIRDLATRARPHTVAFAKRIFERLGEALGNVTIRELTIQAVLEYRAKRVAAGAANNSANHEIGVLKAALAYAVELGQLGTHPLAGMRNLPRSREHQVRPARALSDWELSRLLKCAEELDALDAERNVRLGWPWKPLPRTPFLYALVFTGARYGELRKATWGDVDLASGTLTLRSETTKNGEARALPIAPELLGVLERLPALYREHGLRVTMASPVFLGTRGRQVNANTANFLLWLRRVYERAGIEVRDGLGRVVHIHALRHTFCTRLARSGVPVAIAQKLTGHRTASILLQVYTHIRDDETRKAIEGLPSLGVVGNVETTSDGAERARSSASSS